MLSPEFLIKGVAAPAVTAFAATLILSRLFSGRRAVAAMAFALGQVLGLALTVSNAPQWWPSRNLHWVPWLAVLSAIIGPIVVAGGLSAVERWLLAALGALAAAALVVPDWPELWPTRPISIAAVTFAMTLIARGTDAVTRKQSPRLVSLVLAVTALVASALIAASLSFRLGESALTTAAALAGVAAAVLFRPEESAVRGTAFPFAVAVGGWCYVAAIELPPPDPPIWGLMLIPLAPLLLWLTAVGPVAKQRPAIRWAVSGVVITAYLVAVGSWIWFSTEQESDEYIQARADTPPAKILPRPLYAAVRLDVTLFVPPSGHGIMNWHLIQPVFRPRFSSQTNLILRPAATSRDSSVFATCRRRHGCPTARTISPPSDSPATSTTTACTERPVTGRSISAVARCIATSARWMA